MRSELARLGWSDLTIIVGSHLILPGSHLGEMKICHMNICKWASPARWDRFCFKSHAYVLEFFPNSISNWLRRVLPDK